MNSPSLRQFFALAILVSAFSGLTFGQQPASAPWNLVAPDGMRQSNIDGELTAYMKSGENF